VKFTRPVEADLSWSDVHALRLERHHLAQRAPRSQLDRVVGEIGAVQAQVMSAAELQIAVRVECSVADVREALWKRRTLVKTWLMRGTLHLARASDLPLYTAAMGTRWNVNRAWLRFVQLTEPELWKLVDDIGETLGAQPMTRDQLVAAVGKGRSERVREILSSGWGGMLKPVARDGRLCFGPSIGQSVTFVRPQEWLGGAWRQVDPDVALVEVGRRYLRAYGPANKNDFRFWWGQWLGVGAAAWAGLQPELATVSVEGHRASMLAADLNHLPARVRGQSVQLLPAFDPFLMGQASRDHLFDAAHRAKVSRTAGWISPVVLVDGRVEGVWSHTIVKQRLRIEVRPFGGLSSKVVKQIGVRAESIAVALGASLDRVQVA
jgi:hypothetical protein